MSHNVMLHHTMSHHVTSCHSTSHHVTPCHATSHHVASCHIMSCYITPCHIMSHHVMLNHTMSHHVMLHDTMSHHVWSCHATSHLSCHGIHVHCSSIACLWSCLFVNNTNLVYFLPPWPCLFDFWQKYTNSSALLGWFCQVKLRDEGQNGSIH